MNQSVQILQEIVNLIISVSRNLQLKYSLQFQKYTSYFLLFIINFSMNINLNDLIIQILKQRMKFPEEMYDLQGQLLYVAQQLKLTEKEISKVYDAVRIYNYNQITFQLQQIRSNLLNEWHSQIKASKNLGLCLHQLTKQKFNQRIPMQKINKYQQAFECCVNKKTARQLIIQCIDDLKNFFIKISQYYMESYEVISIFQQNFQKEKTAIEKDIMQFANQCFGDQIKKITQMEQLIQNQPEWGSQSVIIEMKNRLHDNEQFLIKTKPKLDSLLDQMRNIKSHYQCYQRYSEFLFETISQVLEYKCRFDTKQKQYLYKVFDKLMNRFTERGYETVQSQFDSLIVMVYTFSYMLETQNGQYNVTIRKFLKFIFRKLRDFEFGYSNFKVLEYLENANINKQSEILQLLRSENANANKMIKIKLNQINILKLNEQYQNVPLLTFEKISDPNLLSKVITLCSSGFTSQGNLKEKSWRKFINSFHGQVFAIDWESKTQQEMISFSIEKIIKMLMARVTCTIPVIGQLLNLSSIATILVETYTKNPFNKAFQISKITGQFLAYLIVEVFQGHLINLVGFSLGTEVVKETVKHLKKMGKTNQINRVVLMGGVADVDEIKQIFQGQPFQTQNCYSEHDMILKILYKIVKPTKDPCGITQVQLPNIQNINCSDFIQGHGVYRDRLDQLTKRLEIDSDINYLYK